MQTARISAGLVALLLWAGAAPVGAAAPRLYTAGTQRELWICLTSSSTSGDRSALQYRSLDSGGWFEQASFPRLVGGIARHGSGVIAWADDGWWTTHWPGGSGMGPRVRNMASVRAMAGDGQRPWAVGFAAAGDSFDRPSSTAPATATAVQVAPGALFVARLSAGGWEPVAVLPGAAARDVHLLADGETAVVVAVGGEAGQVAAYEVDAGTGTAAPIAVPTIPGAVGATALLGTVQNPLLWTSDGAGDAGRLVPLRREGEASAAVTLKPPADLIDTADRSLTEAAGYLRLLYTVGPTGREVREQRYDRDGTPLGPPMTLKSAGGASSPTWLLAIEIAVLLALLLAVLAAARGRPQQRAGGSPPPRPE